VILQKKVLEEHGIDTKHYDEYIELEEFVDLLMDFIKLSLPDLEYEEAAYKRSELRKIPALNGWWNGKLNVQFGYGLYE
jgi:hypothetical protein